MRGDLMKKGTTPEKGYFFNMTKKQVNKLIVLYILLKHNRGLYGKEILSLMHEMGFFERQELPTYGAFYPLLHEMHEAGLLRREERLLNPDPYEKTYQKVVLYYVTDKGREEYEILRKKYLPLFQRQEKLLNRIYEKIYNQG